MLADLASLKTALRIQPGDTSQDAYLASLLPVADAAVRLFCKRGFETATTTEYPRLDTPVPELCLARRPVLAFALAGTLTQGSPAVTGLSSTSSLVAHMPAVAAASTANALSVLPAGTTVQSVDSATQVTLTANATVSGAATVNFGLAVYLDPQGRYGDGPGSPFGSTTQLLLGVDFSLQRDQGDGTSKSAILRRLGGGPAGFATDWWPQWGRGTLSRRLAPCWGVTHGGIKAVYAYGYGVGAATPAASPPYGGTLPATTTIPVELTYATCMVAAWMRTMVPVGVPVETDRIAQTVADVLNRQTVDDPELVSVRSILRRYREQTW